METSHIALSFTDEYYYQDFYDDVTMPFSPIKEYLKKAVSCDDKISPDIIDILVTTAEDVLTELVTAVIKKAGGIKIKHRQHSTKSSLQDKDNFNVFPVGGIIDVLVGKDIEAEKRLQEATKGAGQKK